MKSWLILLFFMIALPIPPSNGEETLIYSSGRDLAATWSRSATPGITLHEGKAGLELSFDAYRAGGYEWPRLLVTHSGADLSDYSRLIVEVENLSSHEETLLLTAHDSNRNRGSLAGISAPVAPGAVRQVVLDIADGAPLESSEVREIALCLHRPEKASVLRLHSIKAVRNPDFISPRAALVDRLAQTGQMLADVRKGLVSPQTEALPPLEQQFAQAKATFEARNPRYLSATETQLLKIDADLSRLAIQSRNEPLVIWRSPLAQPIQKGTLPLPGDPALKFIRERVALGQ